MSIHSKNTDILEHAISESLTVVGASVLESSFPRESLLP
jgi:hypothetical protein